MDDSESDDDDDDANVNERSEKAIQSQNNLTNIEENHQDDKLEQRRFAESGETHTNVVCPPLIPNRLCLRLKNYRREVIFNSAPLLYKKSKMTQ